MPGVESKEDFAKPEGTDDACNVNVSFAISKFLIVTSKSIATGTPSTNFISYTNASAESEALTVPLDKSVVPVIGDVDASLAEPSAALIDIVERSPSTTPSNVIEELLPELLGEK